jgi:lipopolysaccharide biosynthesis protein
MVHANKGRDVLPFLCCMKAIDASEYPLVLKLHTKQSVHRPDGDLWRQETLSALASPDQRKWIVEQLFSNSAIGLVGAEGHVISVHDYMAANQKALSMLMKRMGLGEIDAAADKFVAGTMFMARRDALETLLSLEISESDFESEAGQTDGTFAHAVERAIAYSAKAVNLHIASVGSGDAAEKKPLRSGVVERYRFATKAPV